MGFVNLVKDFKKKAFPFLWLLVNLARVDLLVTLLFVFNMIG